MNFLRVVSLALLVFVAIITSQARGESLQFDGEDDQVVVTGDAGLGLARFTVEAWFKRSLGGVPYNLIGFPIVNRGFGANFGLGVLPDGRVCGSTEVEGKFLTIQSATTVSLETWHHAALTHDGITLRLFVDGNLEAQLTTQGPSNTTATNGTQIGYMWQSFISRSSWAGKLDEVRIWNFARSPEQIARDRHQKLTFAPGLLANWSFDGVATSAGSLQLTPNIPAAISTSPTYVQDSPAIGSNSPTAAISQPSGAVVIPSGDSLVLSVTGSDPDGDLAKIAIYEGLTKVAESTASSVTVTGLQAGRHQLHACGIDSLGHQGGARTTLQVDVTPASGTGAVFFNGFNAYATAPPGSQLSKLEFTAECWFRVENDGQAFNPPNGAPGVVSLLHRGSSTTNTHFFLGLRPAENVLSGGLGSDVNGNWLMGKTVFTRSVWHHAALSFDGETLRLYLNGQLEGERRLPSVSAPSSTPLQIGCFATNYNSSTGAVTPAGFLGGMVDEVRFWDYARPPLAIDAGRRANYTSASGLIAYWQANEASGTTTLGNSGSSAVVATLVGSLARVPGVTLATTAPPDVSLTAPAGALAINRGVAVSLSANATDVDGNLSRVEFWSQSSKLADGTGSPSAASWTSALSGNYKVSAVAIDAEGLARSSRPITVTVGGDGNTGGVYVDGKDDWVMANFSAWSTMSRFTVETWFRRHQEGRTGTIFPIEPLVVRYNENSFGGDVHFALGLTSDGRIAGGFGAAFSYLSGNTPCGLGEWHHAALTFDGVKTRLFLDGVLEAEGILPQQPYTQFASRLALGNVYYAGFQGDLDRVRIWDYARPNAAIAGSRSQSISAAAGFVAGWEFSESSGSTTSGTGTNAFDLSLVSGALRTGGRVIVIDQPPVVTLSASNQGAPVPAGTTIQLSSGATPGAAAIAKVIFYADAALIGEDASAPYEAQFSPTTVGPVTLRAVAVDASGNSGSAALPIEATPSLGQGALFFNGTSDYVEINDGGLLAPEHFTIEARVRREEGGWIAQLSPSLRVVPILARGMSSDCFTYLLAYQKETNLPVAFLSAPESSPVSIIGGKELEAGRWHHIAVSYDGEYLRLYLDGELQGEKVAYPGGRRDAAMRTAIGTTMSTTGTPVGFFRGYIDDVRIWDYARPGPVIAAISPGADLGDVPLGRWSMDEIAGDVVSTSGSVGSATGTRAGATWTSGDLNSGAPPAVLTLAASASQGVEGDTVNLIAAMENGASVPQSVRFYLRGKLVGEKTAGPWEQACVLGSPGTHRFVAIARLESGEEIISNSVTVSASVRPGGTALHFDGVDDGIIFTADATLNGNPAMELWFRRDGIGQVVSDQTKIVPLIARGRIGESGVICEYLLGIDQERGALFGILAGAAVFGQTKIETGVWYHAALSYSAGTTRLHLNGQIDGVGSFTQDSQRSAAPPTLGTVAAIDGSTHGHFHGAMDEVRIWSGTRTSAQIMTAWDYEIAQHHSLAGRWGLNDGSGNTVIASNVNGPRGRLLNQPLWTTGPPLKSRAAPAVHLQTPVPDATDISAGPTLTADLTVPGPATVTAQFIGDPDDGLESPDFTVVVLPALRDYLHATNGGNPATLQTMLAWVKAERDSRRIVFVTQTGDVVDSASPNVTNAWREASDAFSSLEGPNESASIPFGITLGDSDRASKTIYDTFFTRARFSGRAWFAAAFPSESTTNHVEFFSVGKTHMAIAHLCDEEFLFSNTASVVWLEKIIDRYPDRQFIVNVHRLLKADATHSTDSPGQTALTALADNPRVILIVGGNAPGERRRLLPGVTALSANFSDRPNGGDGWLRLLEFSPKDREIRARTYSPTLQQFETDDDSEFSVPWAPLNPSIVSTSRGAPIPMNATGTASASWPGLAPGRLYQWTAEASDGINVLRAAPRRFRVALQPGAQPPAVEWVNPVGPLTAAAPATIPLRVRAISPAIGIARVDYYLNDVFLSRATTTIPNYFDFRFQPENTGTFEITARATDDQGLTTISAPISIEVLPENLAATPTVAITDPVNGSTFYGLASVRVTIAASVAAPANIASVRLFVNGSPVQQLATAPFELDYQIASLGFHTLEALVTTSAGTSAISAPISLIAQPIQVTRGPYLQMPAPSGMTIRWRTQQSVTGRVWYGPAPEALTSFAEETTARTDHEVRITGLAPGTRYYYGVGISSGPIASTTGPTTFFETPALPGRSKRTRVWAIGNSNSGAASQNATRSAYYTFTGNRRTDLLLLLGDNATNTGADADYQSTLFAAYGTLLRNTPIFATIGDNETGQSTSDSPSYPYYSVFTLPTQGDLGGVQSGTEKYYSFDYGNAHFVCLDSKISSRDISGAMATWLRADLAASNARWKIAFWHHAPYSKGGSDSDTDTAQAQMRQVFNPILEQYGVDLVLSAHSRNYERSFFMGEHYGTSATWDALAMRKLPGLGQPGLDGAYLKNVSAGIANKGTIYVVAGSASSVQTATLDHPAMAVSRNQTGTAVIDFHGNQLELKFLRDTGDVSDWFTVIKPWNSADGDTDGMPDEYETEFALNPVAADGDADKDGDGFSNREEYLAGTDPNDPQSRFTAGLSASGDGFVVRFESLAGRTYGVERCADLKNPEWVSFASGIAGTGKEISVTDPAPSTTVRFYRVRVE